MTLLSQRLGGGLRLPERPRPGFSLATINIVFLLLLFFLVAGSIVQPGESGIDAPLSQRLPMEYLPRPLLVLDETGALHLDGKPVEPAGLLDAARQELGDGGRYLNILAARDLPAQTLLDLVDLLSAGGIPARIVTVREKPRAAPGDGQ